MADQQETPDTTDGPTNRGKQRKRRTADAPVLAEVAIRGKGPRASNEGAMPVTVSSGPVLVSEDVDFEALMGEASASDPSSSFERGAKVSGVVESISLHGEEVFVDLGQKETGYVMKEELRDVDGELLVKVGDRIEGTVAGRSANGIQIRTKVGQEATSAAVREAFEGGLVVEGKVVAANKGGYEIEIGKTRAFCPHSHIDMVRVEDPESMVGRTFDFKIIELRDGNSAVVSRTALLKESQAARAEELMARLAEGQVVRGRVRNIQSFGVFVDLGGKDGLIPMSELAWDRVQDANEIVSLGQEVDVLVLEIAKGGERIGLSLRRTQPDPFESAADKLQVGQIAAGIVKRMETYGAFIELAPGVEGLVHISDMAHYRVRHPKDILSVGESVRVKVQEIDLERHRVSLSLKALAADPWDDAVGRYTVGLEVKGTVEKIADFGVFVNLEPGVTALLPGSEAMLDGRNLNDVYRVGKEVTLRVLRVEADDRKMALSARDAEAIAAQGAQGGAPRARRQDTLRDVRDRRAPRDEGQRGGGYGGGVAYRDEDGDAGKGGVGSLGEALMKALGKKGK